jgi:hypothetical protein
MASTTVLESDTAQSIDTGTTNEAEALTAAYHVLSRGNNGYAGSRVLAMDYIRMAGRTLGLKLEGIETSRESQALSDERFRAARRLLEHARSRLLSTGNREAVENVDEALTEINLALTLEPLPPDVNRTPVRLSDADKEALQLAYTTLYSGNHRYGGHRRAAMFKIQAAGRLAGVVLQGDGTGNEDQAASEMRLQVATRLLEGVRANLKSAEQASVRLYVELALDRLHRATEKSGVRVIAE